MDATVFNISCRWANCIRWYNVWIANDSLVCPVSRERGKSERIGRSGTSASHTVHWNDQVKTELRRCVGTPFMHWHNEVHQYGSSVSALKIASSSVKLAFRFPPPGDSPHFIRLSASHVSVFLPSEAVKVTHCLKESEGQVCVQKNIRLQLFLYKIPIYLYMCVICCFLLRGTIDLHLRGAFKF